MATPRYRAQVTLGRTSGVPEDDIVNVWHFEGDDGAIDPDREVWDSLAAGLAGRIETFYQSLVNFYSQVVNSVTVTLYDVRDPSPRIPRFILGPEDFSTAANSALPSEVALCLSYQAALVPGVSMARRRGRVFLGPFASSTNTGDVVADARPSDALMGAVLDAAEAVHEAGSGLPRLSIYSPTTDPDGLSDASWNDATSIWCDNAWDTQRRRGARATARNARTL